MKLATRIGKAFSTPECWELYQHLTPEERRELDDLNQDRAIPFRRWIAPGFSCCFALIAIGISSHLPWVIWTAVAGTVAYVCLIYRPFEKRWTAKTKELLAQSQHGRALGIGPERIRLLRIPGFD